MFDEDMTIDFVPNSKLPSGAPDGTIARVRIRPDQDGQLGNFKSGKSDYGPWILLPFEVVDGQHRGDWASIVLSVKPEDRRFRAVFSVVTGVNVSQGATVTFAEFKDKLVSGVFQAELGPEKRKNEPTGYTAVKRLIERVGERDELSSDAGSAPAPIPVETGGAAVGDDDIPF